MRRLAVLVCIAGGACAAVANDWPFWRGPEQTGLSREKAPVTTWSLDGQNLLWKAPLGGRTTPIIMNGRVFYVRSTGSDIRLQEEVICLDENTGKVLWENKFNVFDTDIVENRLGWSALVGDPESGNVYCNATGGEFFCFDRDGKLKWKWSMTEMFGRVSGFGGRIMTPIIDEDRVIISFLASSWGNQAKPGHWFVAFDKKTGEVLWWSNPTEKPLDTTYATPAIGVVNGIRMMVCPANDGNVYGLKARTGEKVWSFRFSKRGLNVSAVIDGNYAYTAQSEENISGTVMGRVVCIDASKTGDITESGEVWRLDGALVGYSSPALANGRLYVVTNNADLLALDAKDGKQHWTYSLGRVGKGSPTVSADGVIYVGEENGTFMILRDKGDTCELLDKKEFTRPDKAIDEIYGSPAIANGRLFFMTRYDMYCLGPKTPDKTPVAVQALPAETAGDDKPTRLEVHPAEVTLAPGETAKFSVVQYNATTARSVVVNDAKFAVTGVKLTPQATGTFVADKANTFSAGLVTAKWNGLEAVARVRICPSVPFSYDFNSLAVDAVPPGWLGVTRKAKVVERDGEKVLAKLSTDPSPPFIKIKPYFTPPLPAGYTIQADLLGTKVKDRYMPDMGVINDRYEIQLLGNAQQLRIESWSPLPRFRKDVAFAWQPGVWYTMKAWVLVEGKAADAHATIRAKVWPRDQKEPDAWTLEATDPCPNFEGSAGLFAYSVGTTTKTPGPEVFFDNVKVTRD